MDDQNPTTSTNSNAEADAAVKTDSLSIPRTAEAPASTPPATAAPPPLNLNDLQQLSAEQLSKLSRKLGLHAQAVRSRHHEILDLVRTALNSGGTVTAEGFLDEVGESYGFLRSPRLNFLPVPEDVCVSRALIQ